MRVVQVPCQLPDVVGSVRITSCSGRATPGRAACRTLFHNPKMAVLAPMPIESERMATMANAGRAQVLLNHGSVLPWRDGDKIPSGPDPEGELVAPRSPAPDVVQLLGEGEQHLVTVLVAERRRVRAQERGVDTAGAHHASGTRPVARACRSKALRRATSAAATRRPNRVRR